MGYFQFALFGLVAAVAAAPSGGYGYGAAIAAPAAIVKTVPLADSIPGGLAGLQVKIEILITDRYSRNQ